MTLEDLGSVGEFIAAIATLATLLYLVAEIRQNTRALKSTSFMESQHYFTGIYDTLLQDPVLINLVDSAFDPSRQLSDFSEGERLTLGAFARCVLQRMESQYYLHKSGFLEDEFWEMRRSWLRGWLDVPVWQEWWSADKGQGTVTPSFVENIESATPIDLIPGGGIPRPAAHQ